MPDDLDTQALEEQQSYFDEHPFPGMMFPNNVTKSLFSHIMEKNDLYKIIKQILKPEWRLLDAGCGTGEFTGYLSVDSNVEVIGIDFSRRTIEWAKNLQGSIPGMGNLLFTKEDVFNLNHDALGRFDVVLALGLFFSIPNQQIGLNRLADILKPGGIAIFGLFDPVARGYLRLKIWLLQGISGRFYNREKIAREVLLKDRTEDSEIKWYINQLTEKIFNFHSPEKAQSMMSEAGLTVTDCFPQMRLFGDMYPDTLELERSWSPPPIQFAAQIRWLLNNTHGYFVLTGKKV